MIFLPEPLIQIQNNFTELFLMISMDMMASTKDCTNSFTQLNTGVARALDDKFLKITSSPEPLVQNQNNFTEMFLMMPSTTIAQMVLLR